MRPTFAWHSQRAKDLEINDSLPWEEKFRRLQAALDEAAEWEDDQAHARAQERGEALARKMHADGSLRARSPRREVRIHE